MNRLTGGGPPGQTDSSGALEAMAGGPCGRGVVPRPGYYSRTSTTKPPPPPPKQKIHGLDAGVSGALRG